MKLFRKAMAFWMKDTRAVERVFIDSAAASDTGEHVTEFKALSLSAVWACVNLISGTIGSLPGMVYRTDANGNMKVARDHSLYGLLHDRPNYDQTALDFWEFMQASLELWGSAYARKVFGSMGQLVSLVPIVPSIMTVRRLKTGEIEYRWTEEGKQQVATDADVFHIRGFGGNPLGGMSVMTFGRNTFGRARAIEGAAANTFKNGVRPSGVLTFDKILSAESRNIAETVLVERFTGAMNAGRPLILEGGGKWQQLSINPEDAQMLESQKFSVDDICRWFGVQPYLIGHSGADHMGTGLEQQIIAFVTFTLRRRLKRIEMAVEQQLLSDADRAAGLRFEFNLDGLLRGDTAARYAAYASGLAAGHLTINEVRAYENRAPVDGGDVPRMQMQNVPITMADGTKV